MSRLIVSMRGVLVPGRRGPRMCTDTKPLEQTVSARLPQPTKCTPSNPGVGMVLT